MILTVPLKPRPTLDEQVSHDSDSAGELPTLSTALRLSIAGETLDQHTRMQPATSSQEEMVTFHIPDDMPVDLRIKLAVTMIHLGKDVPEVNVLSLSLTHSLTHSHTYLF